jgi:hypothetical protein
VEAARVSGAGVEAAVSVSLGDIAKSGIGGLGVVNS